jgi:hypothetical protein
MFAQLVLREVQQTLDAPSIQQLEEELIEIGLMKHVRDFLPTDWRKQHASFEAEPQSRS